MSPRSLLEVALRILGVWYLFTALHTLIASVSFIVSGGWGQPNVDVGALFFGYLASAVVYLAFGAGLICCAPAVAAWFYSEQEYADESDRRLGPGDVYHVACFVLGVYLLVTAAVPAGRVINAGLRGAAFDVAGDVFTVIVYMASGVALIVGARRFGELLASLNHDPDSIPKQRISLTILLVLTAVVAVLLGTLRWLTIGAA